LPKGRVEKFENLEDAARREVLEETGISDLTLVEKLGIKERLTYEKNEWRTMHYFLFLTEQKNGKQNLQEDENYEFGWFDFDNLPTMFWPEQKELIEENREKIKNLVKEETGIL
jgi:8-oxo-dGTP pyrophosphatase MutT (NUDIX family)